MNLRIRKALEFMTTQYICLFQDEKWNIYDSGVHLLPWLLCDFCDTSFAMWPSRLTF
jgi:hypothetical protein